MTKQQKNTTAYSAYVTLIVPPFASVKHIDTPSVEISRARRLMGILIDSAKIESAESILISDVIDLYLARNRARSTSGSRQFRFNGVKEAFIPVSDAFKEYLSPAVFRHPAVRDRELVNFLQFRFNGIKRDNTYWAKILCRLSTRSVMRHPKHKEKECAIICLKDIDGDVDIH